MPSKTPANGGLRVKSPPQRSTSTAGSAEFAGWVLSGAHIDVESPPMPPATKTPTKPSLAAPARPLHQRIEALKRANEIRTARAQLKRDLKAGRRSIHDL